MPLNPRMTRARVFDCVWYWRSRLPERKGQLCRVLVRSRRMNSVLVEFTDAFRVVTSRYAVRSAPCPVVPVLIELDETGEF